MRKILSIVTLFVVMLISALGLTACSGGNPPPSNPQDPPSHDCAVDGHSYEYFDIMNLLGNAEYMTTEKLAELETADPEFYSAIQMWKSGAGNGVGDKGYALLKNYHSMRCTYCYKYFYEKHNQGAIAVDDMEHSFACDKCTWWSEAIKTPHTYNTQNKCTVCERDMPTILYNPYKNGSTVEFYDVIITENATGDLTIPSEKEGAPINRIYFGLAGGQCNITSLSVSGTAYLISNKKESIATGATLPNLKKITVIGSDVNSGCTLELDGCPELEEIDTNNGNIRSYLTSTKLTKVRARTMQWIWEENFTDYNNEMDLIFCNTKDIAIIAGAKTVTLDETVTEVDDLYENGCDSPYTFYAPALKQFNGHWSMSHLKEFNAPVIKKLEGYQFYDCDNLETLYLPSTIQELDTGCINDCDNLSTIYWDVADAEINNMFIDGDVGEQLKLVICKNASLELIKENFRSVCTIFKLVEFANDFNQTSIPAETFNYWVFETITIPNSVLTVGERAFAQNTYLRSITCLDTLYLDLSVVEDCPNFEFEEDENATYFRTTLIRVKEGITELIVKDGVKYIADINFETICPDLEKIVLSNDVVEIPEGLFKNLSSLEIVDLGNVKVIGANAFNNCDSLVSITLPQTIESVGDGAFGDCAILENINAGDFEITVKMVAGSKYKGTAFGNGYYIGKTFMSVIDGTRFVRIKDGTTEIYSGAFDGLTALKYVYVPSTVETYENGVFETCTNVILILEANRNLSNSGVENSRMYRNRGVDLNGFEYEASSDLVTITGYYGDVTGTLEIPSTINEKTVYAIGYSNQAVHLNGGTIGAFENNTVITKVILPKSVTTIKQRAFMNSAITEINLKKVLLISPDAFKGCGDLTTVSLTAGVWGLWNEMGTSEGSVVTTDAQFIEKLTNTYSGYTWTYAVN